MSIASTLKHAVVSAGICTLFGATLGAQTTGSVEGTLVGEGGLPLAGVSVTARHIATNTPYRVTSDEKGHYRFRVLPPGRYEVTTADAPSLMARVETVNVAFGATTTVDFGPSTPLAERKNEASRGARARRFEASLHVGYTFAEGVDSPPVQAADGNIYNRVDPTDSVSWGFTFGLFLTPRFELELLFDQQPSTLEASGTNTVTVGDLSISNYHGLMAYNFGGRASRFRPYVFGGFGVTTYPGLTFTGRDGESREVGGLNRLSATFGGGLKIYQGMFGARIEARLTPTYLRSEIDGWYCDDYWGCYLENESQYSHQFQLSGGFIVRF
jgi:hypothetical protein